MFGISILLRHCKHLLADEGGAEVIEYAMVIGLIIVATITTVAAFGGKVLSRWTSLNGSM